MNTVEERQERELLPRVVLALRHAGAAEAFARYLDAAELLREASDRADQSEIEDVDLERSPRVERARRIAARARIALDTARHALDKTLGEDSKLVGTRRGLGVALRQAPTHVLEKARPLVDEALALSGPLAPRRREEDEVEEPDPAPDPSLTKKDCSCGRRIRAYLFDDHTKTCSAVDRTPIVDREPEPEKEEPVPAPRAEIDMRKVLELQGQGKSHVEIGKALGVSDRTIQKRLAEHRKGTAPAAPNGDIRALRLNLVDKLVEDAPRRRREKTASKDLQVLAKCVDLIESLHDNERRAVAYFLGVRYASPARAS
jgi:hypothetical protein